MPAASDEIWPRVGVIARLESCRHRAAQLLARLERVAILAVHLEQAVVPGGEPEQLDSVASETPKS